METLTHAIQFRQVAKTYKSRQREIPALINLNLEVPAGSIYGFAGPNGAGKSTAIKILVGLIHPDQGEVAVFGRRSGTREARKIIGFLPEVTLYHEFMGARELLEIHAALAGVPRKEVASRCQEALARVGLADRSKSRLKEFSKGMKQRFGIAQAILARPKLLILDELTSGLDPQAQASLLELLLELRSQGLTIFFSSHHLREIEKICDSVAIIHKGVLRSSGPLDEVLGEKERVWLKVFLKDEEGPPTELAGWKREVDGGYAATLATSETLAVLKALEPRIRSLHTVETRRRSLDELFADLTSEPTKGVAS